MSDAPRQGAHEAMRALVESVRDYAIFMLDPQGYVLTWNEGARAIKGYEASEIIGQSFTRFYPPEDVVAGKPQRLLAEAAREGRVEDEGWRVRKDGRRIWMDVVITALRNRDGNLVGFTKVTRDLTERRRAALQVEARARQQSVLAALGVFALQSNELEPVVTRARRVLADALGARSIELVEGAERPQGGDIVVPIHGGATDLPSAWLVIGGDGLGDSDIDFARAVANVIAAANARRLTETRARDAERQAEQERVRALRAREAVRDRDEFIAVAAHELRTPLTALQLKLQGLQSLIARGGMEPSKGAERIGSAVRQANRMTELVERLLDVSRIVTGRLMLQLGDCDLAAVVREVVDDLRDHAEIAGSAIRLEAPASAPGHWDGARLHQVASNLVGNAIKYGAGKPVGVAIDDRGAEVVLTVRDHGIGIAREDVDRVFRRFERAAPVSQYGGLGLGLYVTRHIVEAHGGSIDVESRTGEGSTFVVHLPRRST